MPTDNQRALDGLIGQVEIIPQRKVIPYSVAPLTQVPTPPTTEIRRGLFGLRANKRDEAHDERLRSLQQLGLEVAYAERMGIALEVSAINAAGEGMHTIQEIVDSLPEDSVAAPLALHMASDATARLRIRHQRYADLYDAETINVVRDR